MAGERDDLINAADVIADAIAGAFCTPEEEENIVSAINRLALQVKYLGNGDAATSMGGLEALGKVLSESNQCIASALSGVAQAIDRLADAQER
jgi:hypothetical protein